MVGRTHLQDATPLTLGQVVSGWVAQLDEALDGHSSRCRTGDIFFETRPIRGIYQSTTCPIIGMSHTSKTYFGNGWLLFLAEKRLPLATFSVQREAAGNHA